MSHRNRRHRLLGPCLALIVIATALWSPSPRGAGAVGGGPTDVITVAEQPGASPSDIFPLADCAHSTVANVNQFQMLMFRPLYWFGEGRSTAVVPSLSLAQPPLFTRANQEVTIDLKGWRFADGQLVNARSVMLFLNLYRSDPTAYCGYNPGFGIPDQLTSASGRGMTVTLNFSRPVNPTWILYNYLSEITPFPESWDRTVSSTHGGCAQGPYGARVTLARCHAVGDYLRSLALTTTSFTGPLWQSGVDGPWHLRQFSAQGGATFVANPHYSGRPRPQVAALRLLPYASVAAEEADLQAGRIDVGYVDPSVLGGPAGPRGGLGPNWGALAGRFSLSAGPTWSVNYATYNFAPADPQGAVLSQLYVRQALQEAFDQSALITTAFRGYGTPTYSPLPPGTPRSLAAPVTNPYPFDLTAAAALLAAHGWTLHDGVLTCTTPGTTPQSCGAGVPAGDVLSLNVVWASGSPALDALMDAVIAQWSLLGVQVTPSTASFDNVVADCSGGSGYEICAWGTGWSYSPGYYPSGEALFAPGGGLNAGGYQNPQMTALIRASVTSGHDLSAYARFAAAQLPVLYLPQPTRLVETSRRVHSALGLTPNPLGQLLAEFWGLSS